MLCYAKTCRRRAWRRNGADVAESLQIFKSLQLVVTDLTRALAASQLTAP
jgi:hypothetical protein